MACDHYWSYGHAQIQGPKPDQTTVVRHCHKCDRREMAHTGPWQKAAGDYWRDEHFSFAFEAGGKA